MCLQVIEEKIAKQNGMQPSKQFESESWGTQPTLPEQADTLNYGTHNLYARRLGWGGGKRGIPAKRVEE